MEKFPTGVYDRVDRAILALAEDPRPPGWRIRVGDYRLVYEVDDDLRTVTVLLAGHRRDVYRRG